MVTSNLITVNYTNTPTSSSSSTNTDDTTYQWLIAWGVMLVVLFVLNKTRLGHVIIYYSLWLLLFFLIVTQYQFFNKVFAPLGSKAPGGDV